MHNSNRSLPVLPLGILLAWSIASCSPETPLAPPPEIVAKGEAPHYELEFDPRPVPPTDFELVIEMGIGMQHGATGQGDRRVAPIAVDIRLEPDPAASGVPLRASFVVGDVTLSEENADPEVLANWKADLAKLTPRGIRGKLDGDSRGRIARVELKMPNPAPNTVRQLLQSIKSCFELFAVPRPADTIGLGGVLRDRRPVTLSGMDLELDATYTLAAQDETTLTFSVEMTMRANPQLIELPTARTKESKAELLKAAGTGKGTIIVPRDRIGPHSGSLTIPLEMEVRIFYEGKESTMQSTIDLELDLRRKS
jgi:hypothetical protein